MKYIIIQNQNHKNYYFIGIPFKMFGKPIHNFSDEYSKAVIFNNKEDAIKSLKGMPPGVKIECID